MKKSLPLYLLLVFWLMTNTITKATDGDDMPGPLLGFSYGGFNSLHGGFDEIYTDSSMPVEYFVGLGYKRVYLIGKFKSYSANGRSIINNADYIGHADYSQDFFMVGLRFYDQNNKKMRFFLEFGAVSSLVKESISTDARISELSSNSESQNWGFEVSAGATFMLTNFAGVTGSIEYTRIMFDVENGYETGDVNLGGFFISAGIVLMPFSD